MGIIIFQNFIYNFYLLFNFFWIYYFIFMKIFILINIEISFHISIKIKSLIFVSHQSSPMIACRGSKQTHPSTSIDGQTYTSSQQPENPESF